MSVTISSPQQINQHPVNNSTSKQLFSFSKSERFPTSKHIMNHRIAYDLPSMKTKRAAGIGYGHRDIFKNRNDSPPPTNYNMKSEFNPSPSNKAWSFGIAREAYSKVYIKENPLADACVPGPGQYSIPPVIGKEAFKYTLRPKTQNPQTLIYKGQPGPGQYDPKPALNEKGNYFLAKYKSSTATTIDPPSSVRFKEFTSKKFVPGPGEYDPNLEMNKTGSYFVSKFMSSMCRTHYHSERKTLSPNTNTKTPGPGNYRLPSDFGYYEKKFSSTGTDFFASRSSKGFNRTGGMMKSASQPQLDSKGDKNEL